MFIHYLQKWLRQGKERNWLVGDFNKVSIRQHYRWWLSARRQRYYTFARTHPASVYWYSTRCGKVANRITKLVTWDNENCGNYCRHYDDACDDDETSWSRYRPCDRYGWRTGHHYLWEIRRSTSRTAIWYHRLGTPILYTWVSAIRRWSYYDHCVN